MFAYIFINDAVVASYKKVSINFYIYNYLNDIALIFSSEHKHMHTHTKCILYGKFFAIVYILVLEFTISVFVLSSQLRPRGTLIILTRYIFT